MAAAPPSIGAATDALSIGPRPAAAAKNTCPQFEQNTAPAAIAAPHLEQYTVSPRLYSLSREPAEIAAKSYFQAATGSIHIAADPSASLWKGQWLLSKARKSPFGLSFVPPCAQTFHRTSTCPLVLAPSRSFA